MRQIPSYFRSTESYSSQNEIVVQSPFLSIIVCAQFQFQFPFPNSERNMSRFTSFSLAHAPGPFSSNLSNVAYTLLFFHKKLHFESMAKSCLIFTTIFTLKVAQQLHIQSKCWITVIIPQDETMKQGPSQEAFVSISTQP